jgi:hypothetical protein
MQSRTRQRKKAALDRIKLLYDTTGKARGYEEQFPTVREAREVKALLDTVGGRDGFLKMQATLSEVEQIDALLSAGDASVIDRMWQEAPEGMPKLVPHIIDRFAKEKPQEYQQFIALSRLATSTSRDSRKRLTAWCSFTRLARQTMHRQSATSSFSS